MTSQARGSGPRAELFVLSGPDVGRSFEIFEGASLGRANDRAVVLRDKSISRNHAHFEVANGVWSIVDDGSTNGFLVGGVRKERAELTDLGEFVIGEVLVRLRIRAEGEERPAVPAPRPEPMTRSEPANRAESATRPEPAHRPEPANRPEPTIRSAPAARPEAAFRSPPPPPEPDEIVLEDEILLEQAPEATVVTRPRPPVAPPQFARAPSLAAAPRAAPDSGFTAKGQRALQYHKQEARSGMLVTDLSQQPPWLRALLVALGLALAAGLAYGMYRAVLALRGSVAAPSETEEEAR